MPERWNVKSSLIETPHGPAIGCTGLFAYIHSLSDGAWNDACARAALCKVDACFILLGYSRFQRSVASAGFGKPEIISRRASGIFLLWLQSWWCRWTVVGISASGYSGSMGSVVRIDFESRQITWRESTLSKCAIAGAIYF